jgi:hypothetical protein
MARFEWWETMWEGTLRLSGQKRRENSTSSQSKQLIILDIEDIFSSYITLRFRIYELRVGIQKRVVLMEKY